MRKASPFLGVPSRRYARWAQRRRDSRRGFIEFGSFPFDIRTPLPPSAPEVLALSAAVLEELRVPFFVADGTLLGLRRSGFLIPYDTDLDFYVWNWANWQDLESRFLSLGFQVGRRVLFRGRLQQLALYSRRNVIVDINNWWAGRGTGMYNWLPEVPTFRRQSARFFPLDGCPRESVAGLPAPNEPDAWLEFVYGPEWRVPQSEKRDWVSEARDIVRPSDDEGHAARVSGAPEWSQ